MTWSGRTLLILKFYVWLLHIMTFLEVLVTVKKMTISTDSQNADPGLFYGESKSENKWYSLASANVPQVKNVTTKARTHKSHILPYLWYEGSRVNCYKVYLQPQSTASPWMKNRASHHKTPSVLEGNIHLQEKKKITGKFPGSQDSSFRTRRFAGGKKSHLRPALPLKKNFISLDSQRWQPAKEANEKSMCVWKMNKCIYLK